MVGHSVGYGIALTDEFGSEYYSGVVDTIQELFDVDSEGYPNWIMDFPSAEDDQLILGMCIHLHKKMDISQIHQQWENLFAIVPQEIKDLLNKYELPEPDFHVVSGYF